jgi:DNA-directed RNA polymerase subunit RPC12/RpoP
MTYACQNCQKEFSFNKQTSIENLICKFCGRTLLAERIAGYKGVYMSPTIVITRFKSLVEKYGKNKAISDNKFKHEREAWVSAVWALGLNSVSNKEYWIEVETKDNTPDAYVIYFDTITGAISDKYTI